MEKEQFSKLVEEEFKILVEKKKVNPPLAAVQGGGGVDEKE